MPDWDAVHAEVDGLRLSHQALDAFWIARGQEWVELLRQAFGPTYRSYVSKNFWLVCSQPEATCHRLAGWAEGIQLRVNRFLGSAAAQDEGYGRTPIVVPHDEQIYYEYFAGYLEDGEYGGSGGVYLNRGYGHFLFTYRDLNSAEPVLAHELAHSLVSHLPLPTWLNEGVAQLVEMHVSGQDHTEYDRLAATMESYWSRPEAIVDFWSGRGFLRPDEGQMHSYHLAKVLTQKLLGNMDRFRALLRAAHYNDAGSGALKQLYGLTAGDLVADYFGGGEWEPTLQSPPVEPNASGRRACAQPRPFRRG